MAAAAFLVAAWWMQGIGPILPQQATPPRTSSTTTYIEQTNPALQATRATDAGQISAARPTPLPIGDRAPPDRSVGGSVPSNPPAPTLDQLSAERPTAQAGVQLAAEDASAGPAPSATERASGRVTSVASPDGPDRCDPQDARRLSVACDRVIEARAGEFSAPDFQPLSPEQRLLATQREQRSMTADAGSAARRLANGEIDESDAALAVASLAFQPPARDAKKEDPAVDTSAIDAIVAGITTLVTGGPPNP